MVKVMSRKKKNVTNMDINVTIDGSEIKDENCYNNGHMPICNRKREIDIEKERGGNGGRTTTNNIGSDFVTNRHMGMNVTKFKEFSVSDPVTKVFLGKELKKAIAQIPNFNLSAFVREKLREFLEQNGYEIPKPEVDLILLVRCPYCMSKFETTSVKMTRCKFCGRVFRIYRKNQPSRVVKIVKGNMMILQERLRRGV